MSNYLLACVRACSTACLFVLACLPLCQGVCLPVCLHMASACYLYFVYMSTCKRAILCWLGFYGTCIRWPSHAS